MNCVRGLMPASFPFNKDGKIHEFDEGDDFSFQDIMEYRSNVYHKKIVFVEAHVMRVKCFFFGGGQRHLCQGTTVKRGSLTG